jgi:hypothetical protein
MSAIIFLAPISCFDQVLAEDPNVNRLVTALSMSWVRPISSDALLFSTQADSIQLWTAIVSNKLLADTPLVLFLNKCDLLKTKIEAGSHFAKHIVSYGDRPNTFEGCSNCEWYLRLKRPCPRNNRLNLSPRPPKEVCGCS